MAPARYRVLTISDLFCRHFSRSVHDTGLSPVGLSGTWYRPFLCDYGPLSSHVAVRAPSRHQTFAAAAPLVKTAPGLHSILRCYLRSSVRRAINILSSQSFFLFGARGTGKTSLLRNLFANENVLWIDLLSPVDERRYADNPERLSEELSKSAPLPAWVVIDEVQKVPKLLDVVHHEIESRKLKFALTGSSARKLKRGGANLLAGRAFMYNLYPLTAWELGEQFDLESCVLWGGLPRLLSLSTTEEKQLYLKSYVDTYLREEILLEQLIRNVVPFRKFLDVATQANGTVINMSRIAADISVDPKTVQNYFQILEDTLLGFFLPATHLSLRKQQLQSPKFYLFDCGVKHSLDGRIAKPKLTSQEFGAAFEHFIICKLHRLNSYTRARYGFSYLRTKGGLEIDIVVTRIDDHPMYVEINSSENIQPRHIEHLKLIKQEQPLSRAICVSRESRARVSDGVEILPWQMFFETLFRAESDG